MESSGVRYLRVGFVWTRYKALSIWYFVKYIHTETFIIFPSFYFMSFRNPKMPKYAATHYEMTKKTKNIVRNVQLKMNEFE